jgi:hypothetical protein
LTENERKKEHKVVDLKKYLAAMRCYHEVYEEWPPRLGSRDGSDEGDEAAADNEAAQGHHRPKKRLSNRHLKRRPWK